MHILGVKYHNLRLYQALKRGAELLEDARKHEIFFLNLECLRIALSDGEYRRALKSADLVLSDGVGIKYATWLFGAYMRQNCNGTDFSPLFLKYAARKGYKVYFLGAKEGIAEKAAEKMRQLEPKIKIVGTHSGFFDGNVNVVEKINASGADVLLVAMGAPRQEKWIQKHREALKPRMCLGVGALFDWLSDTMPRAPKEFQKLHLEWVWRIYLEPKRMFKRYVVDGMGFMVALSFKRFELLLRGK